MYMLNCTLRFQSFACMRLLLGAKSVPFGCMSMARLGAKYAEVGCKVYGYFSHIRTMSNQSQVVKWGAATEELEPAGSTPDGWPWRTTTWEDEELAEKPGSINSEDAEEEAKKSNGAKHMDTFGCMSMPFGCMYAAFGCMYMARLGACMWLFGACLTVGSLPDSR